MNGNPHFLTDVKILRVVPSLSLAAFSGCVNVIDADTIDVDDVRGRIHGTDAPEKAQTCQSEQNLNWACGEWVN